MAKTTGNERLDRIIKNLAKGHIPHSLWSDNDKNPPEVITDQNGMVCLSLCKNCGQAESELEEFCPNGKVTEIVRVKANKFAMSSTFSNYIRDGMMTFEIESDYHYITLFLTTKGMGTAIFTESNTVYDDNFEEARIDIVAIMQAYGVLEE